MQMTVKLLVILLMTNDVVIAHYKERLSSWVHLLPEANVIVYTKGKPEKFQPHPKVNEVIPLPIVGRESHTYLTHIVKNYPLFPAVTLFLQGNPRRHGYKFNFEKYFSIELGKCSSVMKLASRVSTKLYAARRSWRGCICHPARCHGGRPLGRNCRC